MTQAESIQEGHKFATEIAREPPPHHRAMIREALDIQGDNAAFRLGLATELRTRRIIGARVAERIKRGVWK